MRQASPTHPAVQIQGQAAKSQAPKRPFDSIQGTDFWMAMAFIAGLGLVLGGSILRVRRRVVKDLPGPLVSGSMVIFGILGIAWGTLISGFVPHQGAPAMVRMGWTAITVGCLAATCSGAIELLDYLGRARDPGAPGYSSAMETAGKWFWLVVAASLVLLFEVGAAADQINAVSRKWGWVLSLLPTILVAQQGMFVVTSKGKNLRPDPDRAAWTDPGHQLQASLLQREWESSFATGSQVLRFGVPALLLGAVCFLMFELFWSGAQYLVLPDKPGAMPTYLLVGGRAGLAGAYAYVLTHLGVRGFRGDLTGGGAMWCVVTMVLGPGLALFLTWAFGGAVKNETFSNLHLVCFGAGLAPRMITEWLVDGLRGQLFKKSPVVVPNNRDLVTLRGITPAIAERLGEEGIEDAYGLAFHDPYRLIRNTNFSYRQILAWMDEALLWYYLPDKAEILIKRHGITGVMDLANLYDQVSGTAGGAPPSPSLPDTDVDKVLTALAKEVDLSDDGSEKAAFLLFLRRIHEDEQVARIWVLYQGGGQDGGALSEQAA